MYEDRLIAYLDILGFSDLVEATLRDPNLIDLLDKMLEHPKNVVKQTSKMLSSPPVDADLRITSFSDAILLSTNLKEHSHYFLMTAIDRIAYSLIKTGRLLRGAIVFGKIIHTDNAVFGPGVIDAWKKEQAGFYPRVVVPDEIAAAYLSITPTINGKKVTPLARSQDGLWHLNVPGKLSEEMLETGRDCLRLIAQSTHKERDRRKVIWTIEEWNRELAKHNLAILNDGEIHSREIDLFKELATIRARKPWDNW